MIDLTQIEEKIERVKASQSTLDVWRKNHSSTEWIEASEVNKFLFGMPLSQSCNNCIDDLFIMINSGKTKAKIKMEKERKYFLKEDIVVRSHNAAPCTSESSDVQLKALLKANPKNIKNFTKVPDNWAKECGTTAPAAAAEATVVNLEDLSEEQQSRVSELVEGNTAAVLKTMIADTDGAELPKKTDKTSLAIALVSSETPAAEEEEED